MRQKVKAALTSDLIKVTSSTSVSTAIKLAASFIISKILAVIVGPSGIALLGQLTNIGTIFQSLSSGGIQVGVTKYISEFSDDEPMQKKIVGHALKITFLCSIVSSLIIIAGYRFIGSFFFKTNEFNGIILLLGITLILYSFNALFISIVNGYKQYREYVVLNIITSVVTLVVTVSLVYFYELYGAFAAFVIGPSVVFFITWFYIRKYTWLDFSFFNVKLEKKILRLLGKFSLMAINNAFVGAAALIVIRTFITSKLSIDVAGVWDAMNKLSAAYMLLFTSSIQVYYLPTLSYIQDKKMLWKEIIKTQKIILPIVFFFFFFLFLFKGIIIEILFSKEFYMMKSIFAYQLFGDLIKVASWILSYTMYAKALSKQLIFTDNLFTVSYISLSYFLMENMGYGLNAIYIGYIINNIIYLVLMYILIKRYTGSKHA